MSSVEEMTDEELKGAYLGLYETIYVIECYSSHDIIMFYAIEGELLRRGYVFREQPPLIVKEEDYE